MTNYSTLKKKKSIDGPVDFVWMFVSTVWMLNLPFNLNFTWETLDKLSHANWYEFYSLYTL